MEIFNIISKDNDKEMLGEGVKFSSGLIITQLKNGESVVAQQYQESLNEEEMIEFLDKMRGYRVIKPYSFQHYTLV